MAKPKKPRKAKAEKPATADVEMSPQGDTKPRGRGRPSDYSPEMADLICERMVSRNEQGRTRALHTICAEDDDMPDESTVYRWLLRHDEFRGKYDRAREKLAEIMANEVVHIADTEPDPQIARVRILARQWYAGKIAPKRYGDKLALTDADGGTLKVQMVA